MTNRPLAPDQAVRAQVLAPDRSFIVQAPAGSGKTTLLTQRFLCLLATVERPEQIVAITFTRKAAAEMRHRITAALRAATRQLPADAGEAARDTWRLARAALERDADHGWHLLAQPSRLHISTIDGLNHWLARHLPLSSRLGAGLELVDDARPLYREAAQRFVRRLEEDSAEGRAVVRLARLLDHDPARLAGLLAGMLGKRDLWLPRVIGVARGPQLRARMEAVLTSVVEQGLAAIRQRLATPSGRAIIDLLYELAQAEGAASPHSWLLGSRDLPPARAGHVPQWHALRDAVLTAGGAIRKRVDVRQGFPTTQRALKKRYEELLAELSTDVALADALAAVGELPPPHYTTEQWEVVGALCDVLVPAAAELQALFAERGRMDHAAVAGAAQWALGAEDQPTDLGLALDYRVQHLLVDEFQDTSQSQESLLRRLVAGWESTDGRTLFCVGDPMQSIYAFREADVTLFLAAQRRGIGSVALDQAHLSANFRSSAAVIDWINATFARLLPAEDDFERGAVHYTPCLATRPDEPGAGVRVHPFIDGDDVAEGALVARLVAEAALETERLEEAEGQLAVRREIAVLVRGRAVLPAIVAALRGAGIPYRGVEIEALAERAAVRDLLALARALLHAGDRPAWLAVLRAPWCGLTLADLEQLAGPDGNSAIAARIASALAGDVPGLSADGLQRLARIQPALVAAAEDIGRGSLGTSVRAAWLALGGPATLEDISDLDNAGLVFATLDGLTQEAGVAPLPSLLEAALADLKASPVGSETARVQLMTIHKAKGLEFDTVIVPGLGRGVRGDDRQLLNWQTVATAPETRELLLASTAETGTEDPLEQWMRRLERERHRLEVGRLAYVAATRARRRLHLVGSAGVKRTDDGAVARLKPPPDDTLLAFLWNVLEPEFERELVRRQAAGDLQPSADAERPRASAAALRRLPAGFSVPPPPTLAWSPQRAAPGEAAAVRPDFDWAGQVAIVVGTVVHAELVARSRPGFREPGAAQAEQRWRSALRAAGVPPDRLDEALGPVGRALAGVATSARARHLLDPGHAEAASELALTALLGGELVSVKIDRTFVDPDGIRWIVDWKTGSHEGGERELFLAHELARYSGQLARYAAVLKLFDGRPQRVGMYYPLLDAWVDWSPASGGEPPPD